MAATQSLNLIVFGAGGKVGRKVVSAALAHNHQVTAFARDKQRLLEALGTETFAKVRVVEGDAFDAAAVNAAVQGHNAIVNAALPLQDLQNFSTIVKNILESASSLASPKRVWIFGGAAALTYPKIEKMVVDYGAPPVYQMHKKNFELTQLYPHLDWSFACPGPMIDSPTPGKLIENLRISTDYVAFRLTPEEEQIPPEQGIVILKNHMSEITLPYEDVAEVVVTHLAGDGPYRHKRVGFALPEGKTLTKEGWSLGQPIKK